MAFSTITPDKVSLCSPGCPETHTEDQDNQGNVEKPTFSQKTRRQTYTWISSRFKIA